MAIDPRVLTDLQARAARVSAVTGHDVRLVSPDLESVTLSVDGTVVSGPDRLDDAAARSLDLALAALESRTLAIVVDADGLPRVVSADEAP